MGRSNTTTLLYGDTKCASEKENYFVEVKIIFQSKHLADNSSIVETVIVVFTQSA